MNYGSSAYGSVALGGLQTSGYLFFSPTELVLAGTYSRSIEYPGSAEFFEVRTVITGGLEEDADARTMRIYSHNDPGETPQLQVTVGLEAFYTQSIIGAARFIIVEVEMPTNAPGIPTILITGNEYFQ
jgi:hypothetical protein